MLRITSGIVCVILLTLLSLNQAPYPYLWIFALWMIGLALCMRKATGTNSKAIFVNLLVFVAALLGLEVFAIYQNPPDFYDRNYSSGYRQPHPFLGYAPVSNNAATAKMLADDQVIYDVTYTIDEHGLRRGPLVDSTECVLFFGGSYAFGEGVADDEAIPWLVGKALDVRTYNYSFHGYGPHQMLANIEHGRVTSTADCEAIAAVYVLIDDHIFRSAGKASWDKDGPEFIIDEQGRAVQTGTFSDDQDAWGAFSEKVVSKLDKSIAYQYLVTNRRTYEPRDVELLISIVVTAKEALQKNSPQLRFLVLHWDYSVGEHTAVIQEALQAEDIALYPLSNRIKDLHSNPKKYRLPVDGHPNPAAQRAAADYVTEILQASNPTTSPRN